MKQILLLEDKQKDIDEIKAIFAENDPDEDSYQLITARNSYTFAENLGETANPAMFLLDIRLGGQDSKSGLDILKELRANARYQYTPIIMLTSDNYAATIMKAFEAGCAHYIEKGDIEGVFWESMLDKLALYEIFENNRALPPNQNFFALAMITEKILASWKKEVYSSVFDGLLQCEKEGYFESDEKHIMNALKKEYMHGAGGNRFPDRLKTLIDEIIRRLPQIDS